MLFAVGLVYAGSTLRAEHLYAKGMGQSNLSMVDRVLDLRLAGKLNPFDPVMRTASARFIGAAAVQSKDPGLLYLAHEELNYALYWDYSDANMLLKMVVVSAMLGNQREADLVYELYKATARNSKVIKEWEEKK